MADDFSDIIKEEDEIFLNYATQIANSRAKPISYCGLDHVTIGYEGPTCPLCSILGKNKALAQAWRNLADETDDIRYSAHLYGCATGLQQLNDSIASEVLNNKTIQGCIICYRADTCRFQFGSESCKELGGALRSPNNTNLRNLMDI